LPSGYPLLTGGAVDPAVAALEVECQRVARESPMGEHTGAADEENPEEGNGLEAT
jgi:hypothetical protein